MEASLVEILLVVGICPLLLIIWALVSRKAYYCPQCELKVSRDDTSCPRCGNDFKVGYPL